MPNEWVGVVHTTAQKYLSGAADNTIRNRLLLSLLRRYGRMEFNQNGYNLTWDVMFDQQPVESYGDAGLIDFSRHDLYRQLTIEWGGYVATDRMTYKEKAMNSGGVAIVNRYGRIMPTLMQTLQDTFCGELYGDSAGDVNKIDGIETFLGTGTTVAADVIAEPSDTYAGQSTALAPEGGSWTSALATPLNANAATDWPDGQGEARYDWNSPKIVNYSSTNWGTGSTAWSDNCERAIRRTILWLTHGGGRESRPTCFLLSNELFYDYLNKQESKQRIIIPHKEANDLGFPDVMNQHGVMIQADYDVPAGVGYGMNVNQMMLSSLHSQLFWNVGPDDDPKTLSYIFLAGFFGNARYNPKHFAALKAVA